MFRTSRSSLLVVAAVIATTSALTCQSAVAADVGAIATGTTSIDLPGDNPNTTSIGLSADHRTAYAVASSDTGNHLATIDLGTQTLVRSFAIGDITGAPQTTVDGSRLVISARAVQELDPVTGTVIQQRKDLNYTSNIVVGPRGKRLYAVDQMSGTVLALDVDTLATAWRTRICGGDFKGVDPADPESPGPRTGLAITPDGGTLVATCLGDGAQFLSAKSGKFLGAAKAARSDAPVVFNAAGSRAYLARKLQVTSLDVQRRAVLKSKNIYQSGDGDRGTIDISWQPALSANGKVLYVPWLFNGVLKSVNTSTLKATSIALDGKTKWKARKAVLSPNGKRLFVMTDNTLVTIDPTTGKVIGNDPAVTAGNVAEDMVANDTVVAITWASSGNPDPLRAGVTLLTLPAA